MRKIILNGRWELAEAGKAPLCEVQVPGSVLSGLYGAGKIEDPFYRTNEDATRELFWKDYEFCRTFMVTEDALEEEKVVLVCEGLDTLTDIYINGKKAGSTDNMHRTWKLDVKEFLHSGENQIRIVFRSVFKYIEDYEYEENKEIHYVPCGGMKGNQLIRKAHCMFGWDWGPQTIDAGIFRDIYLEVYSHSRIEDVKITQRHGDNAVDVCTMVAVSGNSVDKCRVRVSVREDAERVCGHRTGADDRKKEVDKATEDGGSRNLCIYTDENADTGVVLNTGSNTADSCLCSEEEAQVPNNASTTLTSKIHNPKLWWPNGYGDQPLYKVKVELLDENGTVLETIMKRIGLRTLTISQEKDLWGKEFAFCVNGVKIFAMGGNYIPEGCIYSRITPELQEYLLESCKRANFNCVRVWGGGYYPSDHFYDLCDEMGLIVWQDLMFACNVYDLTEEFEENITKEITENVKRLRHHASLGLWCGNNEMESAWDHWPEVQTESKYLRADYIKMFEHVVPKAVKAADSETFFWQSSPSSGGCFDDPDDENRGDCHYWDVWHGQKPFIDYQKHYFRFCSEFGFQSFPCLKTVESFTEEKDRNIFSRVMENHQKNPAANGKILYYLSENFRYPENFRKLLYVSQILQGMAMKYGVDHWRRHRGRCMGTLYWQINDNWPVASWASIDYFGRWKALHYMAKKFYAPQAVSMCRDGDIMQVYLENESMKAQPYQVAFYVKNMECEILEKITRKGTVGMQESGQILNVDISRWEDKKYEVFLEAEVTLADRSVLCDVETLVPYKYLELDKPEITVEVEEQDEAFVIHLKSSCFSPFTAIGFTDADVVLEDNFFHMTGAEAMSIRLEKKDIRSGEIHDVGDITQQMEILTLA